MKNNNRKNKYLFIGISIPTIGFFLDFTGFSDTSFERSGCLLVAFAILLAGKRLSLENIDKSLLGMINKIESKTDANDTIQKLKKSDPEIDLHEIINKNPKVQVRQKLIDAEGHIKNKIFSMNVIEPHLGIGGTLIWGFGDLIMDIISVSLGK